MDVVACSRFCSSSILVGVVSMRGRFQVSRCWLCPACKVPFLRVGLVLIFAMAVAVKCDPLFNCSEDGQYIPESHDCSVFYVCKIGMPVLYSCSLGSCFDSAAKQCVSGPATANTVNIQAPD